MKKNNLHFIVAGLIFLNLFTLFKLYNLENTMESRFQQNEMAHNNLQGEISNICINVDAKLKKQASILDNYNITFGDELNADDLTIPVTLSITPKIYSDGLTAYMLINNLKIPMQKNGTTFSAETQSSIFDNLQLKVILKQDGIEKTESIEEYSDLQYKFLLDLFGGFSGDYKYSSGKFQYKGEINLKFSGPQNNSPEKISIVKEMNGTIIDEQPVDISNDMTIIPVDGEVKMAANDRLIFYVNVQDKYGLNYKYIVLAYEIDSNGKSVKGTPEWTNGSIMEISDRSGNILYMPKYLEK
ncbi:MAG: hypothetical protein ACERLG_03435 [Sedimentibacter sp.]